MREKKRMKFVHQTDHPFLTIDMHASTSSSVNIFEFYHISVLRRRGTAVVHVAGAARRPGSRVRALHHPCCQKPPRQPGTQQHRRRRPPVPRPDAIILSVLAARGCRRRCRQCCGGATFLGTGGSSASVVILRRRLHCHASIHGFGGVAVVVVRLGTVDSSRGRGISPRSLFLRGQRP